MKALLMGLVLTVSAFSTNSFAANQDLSKVDLKNFDHCGIFWFDPAPGVNSDNLFLACDGTLLFAIQAPARSSLTQAGVDAIIGAYRSDFTARCSNAGIHRFQEIKTATSWSFFGNR
ncbi:hypothetical protein K2X30_10630 [bacterium]|jgi:hypothetical protein|nr:hypothetical protein [bacterium]